MARDRRPNGFGLVANLAASQQAGRQTHAGLARVCARFLELDLPLAGWCAKTLAFPKRLDGSCRCWRAIRPPAARDVQALAHRMAAGL